MGKFENDAREMLRLVGGKENIAALPHCVTRMRCTCHRGAAGSKGQLHAGRTVPGDHRQRGR